MKSKKVLNKGTWRNNDNSISTKTDTINIVPDNHTIQTSLVITTLDEQLEKLYNDFKYLDSVLHTISNRNELASFSKIKEGIEQLSSLSFTLEDMSIIMLLFPKSFNIIWKEVSIINYETNAMTKTMTMCLFASDDWIKDYNNENGQLIRPTIMNRSKYFKKTLDTIKESRKGSTDTIQPDLSIFPPKPDVSTNFNTKQTEALALAKIAKDKKRKLLTIADEELKEIENVGTSGLDSIRQLAEKRQKAQVENDEKKNADNKLLERNTRIKSLPSICDALRSLCISTSRNIRPMKELVNTLASDFRLQPKELHQRLKLLHDVAPEFINILPADNIVNITTVRINLDCPYGQVRDKIYKLLRI
jgi:hypothetical protein